MRRHLTSVNITITGTNDAALISGNVSGTVDEDAVTNTATGTLTASDVDNVANLFQAASGTTAPGTFAVDTTGAWTYNDSDECGRWTNRHAPDILGSVCGRHADLGHHQHPRHQRRGGSYRPTHQERDEDQSCGRTNTTSGTLTISDVDNPSHVFGGFCSESPTAPSAVDTAGAWTYGAQHANEAVDAVGQPTPTDVLGSVCGRHLELVNVNIPGTNDAAFCRPTRQERRGRIGYEHGDSRTLTIRRRQRRHVFQAACWCDWHLRHVCRRRGRRLELHGQQRRCVCGRCTQRQRHLPDASRFGLRTAPRTSVTINILGTNDAAVLLSDNRNLDG